MSKYVYLHLDCDGVVRYVGQGTGSRAYQFSSTRRSKEWCNLFGFENKPTVEIVKYCSDQQEADNLEADLLKKHCETVCNIRPVTKAHNLSLELFSEWFYVDESSKTGLRWKKKPPRSTISINDEAGSVLTKSHSKRYWQIKLMGKVYKVHRIVYLLTHGKISESKMIDHLNGNGLDNNPKNLLEVSALANSHNRKVSASKKLKVKHIQETKSGFSASFQYKGKNHYISLSSEDFETREQALSEVVIRVNKLREYFGRRFCQITNL